MRPIEFRTWDKELKHFNFSGFYFLFKPLTLWYDSEDGPIEMNKNDFEINQFTGLLDKNGKKIFEGDIIQMDYKDYKAEVVFWERPPEFGFKPLNEDKWIEDWNITDDHCRVEVIGNIYQDSHLLEKE